MVQGFGGGLGWAILASFSHVATVRCWLWLQASEDATGLDIEDTAWSAAAAHCWLGAQLGHRLKHLHVPSPLWKSQGNQTSYMRLPTKLVFQENQVEAAQPILN